MEQEDLNNSSEWFDGTVTVFARCTVHQQGEKRNAWWRGRVKSPLCATIQKVYTGAATRGLRHRFLLLASRTERTKIVPPLCKSKRVKR